MTAVRAASCVAWMRRRPGTGGLFRVSWDNILIAARGILDAVGRAAVLGPDFGVDRHATKLAGR
jgi:hypothetical protein